MQDARAPLQRAPHVANVVEGDPEIVNAFSVDVEDYFQVAALADVVRRQDWDRFEPRVERNTLQLLGLLEQHSVKATWFVLGWVAERWPALVREICAAGHELALHGYDHQPVTAMTPSEFRADVRKSRQILEEIAGVEVIGYRAPSYSIVGETLWATGVLAEEGFRYDSSIFPIVHDRYGIPAAHRFPGRLELPVAGELHEFPISTLRFAGVNLPFVGGGYLRLLPMRYVRWGMRRLNRQGHPAIVYVHPWEIDPHQPRLPAKWSSRLRHYRNLDRTWDRLVTLLTEFRFTTVRETLGLLAPGESPRYPTCRW
jgi:polysaccharide deacetylase family protein (PEP-CTERM system associated)